MQASILASGYITYPNENLIVKPIEENIYIKYVIVKDYLSNHGKYFYSEEIDYLFRMASCNDLTINQIDNKIRVIKLAKMLFNGKGLLDWVRLQEHNPLISISHIDFIKDTLAFLFEGKDRRLHPSLWVRLIEPNLVNKDNIVDINKYLEEVIRQFNSYDGISLSETISRWFTRPNGYMDLLNTLYIFYGPRDKVYALD